MERALGARPHPAARYEISRHEAASGHAYRRVRVASGAPPDQRRSDRRHHQFARQERQRPDQEHHREARIHAARGARNHRLDQTGGARRRRADRRDRASGTHRDDRRRRRRAGARAMKSLLATLRALRFTDGGVSRPRIALLVLAFAAVHLVIGGRLVLIGMKSDTQIARRVSNPDMLTSTRPDILDREGKQLATDVQSAMLYAEPKKGVGYVDDAVDQLRTVLPDLDERELREKLSSRKGFVRLKREITAEQQHEIRKLGIPHVGFLTESKRVYPAANEASHVLGGVNVDSVGIAGLEKWVDSGGLADLHMAGFATGRSLKPVQLSLDLDVQHAMRDELMKAQESYQAKSTSGMVFDVRTGEILAMVSLPDYDPNKPGKPTDLSRLNRLTTGVYEMGSTFKALTVAMALDSGKATLASKFDATAPLHYGKFTITDFHAQRRMLTVPEVFTYSSNIGAAKMALAVGVEGHKAFLKKMGQLDRLRTELPESAMPLVP